MPIELNKIKFKSSSGLSEENKCCQKRVAGTFYCFVQTYIVLEKCKSIDGIWPLLAISLSDLKQTPPTHTPLYPGSSHERV